MKWLCMMLAASATVSGLVINSARSGSLVYKGIDWSSTIVEERAGRVYKTTTGVTKPLESVLASSGVNTVRQRLWYTSGDYGLDYNLALAKRAKAAGLNVYLDIFYSPTWTDAGNQATPADWANYNIGDLKYAVYNYTLATMNAFASAGIPLTHVSLGNEIRAGMLWPLGKIANAANLAGILHSAAYGVKDSNLASQPRLLVHLDNGWDYSAQQYFYDTVLNSGGGLSLADFDAQAVSYYPFYSSSATLASLKSSLTSMKSKYGKDVMVVETNWPTSCPNPSQPFPADTTSIPFSPAGQTTWMTKVADIVKAVGGSSLFYWEPMWIDNAGLGSSCDYNLQVATDGTPLSSLAVYSQL